jgi:hypothetical protein
MIIEIVCARIDELLSFKFKKTTHHIYHFWLAYFIL